MESFPVRPPRSVFNPSIKAGVRQSGTRLWTYREHLQLCLIVAEFRSESGDRLVSKLVETVPMRMNVSPRDVEVYLRTLGVHMGDLVTPFPAPIPHNLRHKTVKLKQTHKRFTLLKPRNRKPPVKRVKEAEIVENVDMVKTVKTKDKRERVKKVPKEKLTRTLTPKTPKSTPEKTVIVDDGVIGPDGITTTQRMAFVESLSPVLELLKLPTRIDSPEVQRLHYSRTGMRPMFHGPTSDVLAMPHVMSGESFESVCD